MVCRLFWNWSFHVTVMVKWHGFAFHIAAPLWFPSQGISNEELRFFLCYQPAQGLWTVSQVADYLRHYDAHIPSKYFHDWASFLSHYNDVIMVAMASQITGVSIVCSTVYSGGNQRKHQSSASLACVCVWGGGGGGGGGGEEFTGDQWIRGNSFHFTTSSGKWNYLWGNDLGLIGFTVIMRRCSFLFHSGNIVVWLNITDFIMLTYSMTKSATWLSVLIDRYW